MQREITVCKTIRYVLDGYSDCVYISELGTRESGTWYDIAQPPWNVFFQGALMEA